MKRRMAVLVAVVVTGLGVANGCSPRGEDMSESTNDIPIACAPLALTAAERARSRELREMLARATRQTREHEDGYSFRYDDDREVFQRAAEWIVLERLCCPFLSFELSWERGTEAPWLRVRGPEGTKKFLQAEMPELPRE